MTTPDEKDRAFYFCQTLMANVDNTKLSDAEFRTFVRNSLTQFKPAGQRSTDVGHEQTTTNDWSHCILICVIMGVRLLPR